MRKLAERITVITDLALTTPSQTIILDKITVETLLIRTEVGTRVQVRYFHYINESLFLHHTDRKSLSDTTIIY